MRALCILMFIGLMAACNEINVPPVSEAEQLPAGGMTASRLSDRTFVVPGKHLSNQEKLAFWTGFSLFRDPWVIAPSSTKDRDGLGPLFNTRSCISCHSSGGRGPAPQEGEFKPSALVIRLGTKSGSHQSFEDTLAFRQYGGQIQPRAIAIGHHSISSPLAGEALLQMSYELMNGQFDDGSPFQLRKPNYRLTQLSKGKLDDAVGLSPRFAPIVYGAGLLDAIDEKDLLAQQDINDQDKDGISAKYNRVIDVQDNAEVPNAVGRFGHKAKHPNLLQQVAAAFRDDIGITSTYFPFESCTPMQPDCAAVSKLGGHAKEEIPDKLLTLVNQFNQFLAVPPARNLRNKTVIKGRELFYQSGCESCHTASYKTRKDYRVSSLAGQTIWPYTDLALHDMGQGLADGVDEFEANGQEWRTPPLWGLGAQLNFRKQPLYLHDGRARSLEEAILWHGGEATSSKNQFIKMNASDRNALIAFLNAI